MGQIYSDVSTARWVRIQPALTIGCERSRHLPPPNLEQRTPHCSPHEGADRREDKPRGQSFVLPYRPPGQGTRKDKHQEGQHSHLK